MALKAIVLHCFITLLILHNLKNGVNAEDTIWYATSDVTILYIFYGMIAVLYGNNKLFFLFQPFITSRIRQRENYVKKVFLEGTKTIAFVFLVVCLSLFMNSILFRFYFFRFRTVLFLFLMFLYMLFLKLEVILMFSVSNKRHFSVGVSFITNLFFLFLAARQQETALQDTLVGLRSLVFYTVLCYSVLLIAQKRVRTMDFLSVHSVGEANE